ncbi:MAG: hypothetical protein HY719_07360 [Planctomycetes bacterium]|nr:hypothetical protein [Planctomycetota bacterium]
MRRPRAILVLCGLLLLSGAAVGCASNDHERPVALEDRTDEEYFAAREVIEFPYGIVKGVGGAILFPIAVISPPPFKDGMTLVVNWFDSAANLVNPTRNDPYTWDFSPQGESKRQAEITSTMRKFNSPENSRILE